MLQQQGQAQWKVWNRSGLGRGSGVSSQRQQRARIRPLLRTDLRSFPKGSTDLAPISDLPGGTRTAAAILEEKFTLTIG